MTMSDQSRKTAPPRTTAARGDVVRDRLHWFGSRYALVGVWLLMVIRSPGWPAST
jgi:hypothetical protein